MKTKLNRWYMGLSEEQIVKELFKLNIGEELICGKNINPIRERGTYKKRKNYPHGRNSSALRSYTHWKCLGESERRFKRGR